MYGIIIFMDWSTKRKILYGLIVSISVGALIIFFLRSVLFPAPTCSDKKQNGYETGVDCGGVCSLRCSVDVSPMVVLWSKAIQVSKNSYDVVGMVSNKNIDNASYRLGYVFTAYDNNRSVIRTLAGTTTAPVDGNFPIILQNVPFEEIPAEISLELHDTAHFSVLEKPDSPTLRILSRRYENGTIPRVYVTIKNTKQRTLEKLPVYILLFDSNDNVYASAGSVIPFLDKESVEELVFTWNAPFTVAPTRIGVYPIFNPFQGIQE